MGAGGVLALVGVGHHLTWGLASAGLLVLSSPWTLRWVAGR
jgi:hypothetical protein